MPECGQDRASRYLVQKLRGQREGTQLIMERPPLWENEKQIGGECVCHAFRINQENGGGGGGGMLPKGGAGVFPSLSWKGLQILKKFQETNCPSVFGTSTHAN